MCSSGDHICICSIDEQRGFTQVRYIYIPWTLSLYDAQSNVLAVVYHTRALRSSYIEQVSSKPLEYFGESAKLYDHVTYASRYHACAAVGGLSSTATKYSCFARSHPLCLSSYILERNIYRYNFGISERFSWTTV